MAVVHSITLCDMNMRLQGIKYSMAKWLHVGHYATGSEAPVAIEQGVQHVPKPKGACEDENDFCDSWASTGECTNNVAFMIGSKHTPGKCMKSCNMCHLLKEWREEEAQQLQGQGQGQVVPTSS